MILLGYAGQLLAHIGLEYIDLNLKDPLFHLVKFGRFHMRSKTLPIIEFML